MEMEKTDLKTEMRDLILKLSKIQNALRVPKDLKNSFGNYKYRNAEGILEALKEVMPEGCITFATVSMAPAGYEVLTETFTDGISVLSSSIVMPPVQSDRKGMTIEQVYGCRISYARKYALCMLYAIDDSKDDPDSKDNTKVNATKDPLLQKYSTYKKWETT
jgi:hypothetical protein